MQVRKTQTGFTVIEVMIALTVLLIGIVGILTMAVSITRESAFSRHTVEASTLGEDKMEELMAMPTEVIDPGGTGVTFGTYVESVNSLGQVSGVDCDPPEPACDPPAFFTRDWQLVWETTSFGTLTVRVTWQERGQSYTLNFASQRTRL